MPPGDAYGYRGNHVGTSYFPSRGPRRFPPHQTDSYWRSSNLNNSRPEHRNRPLNMHHNNNGIFSRGQGYRGGFQRGGRRYFDHYNRERHNGTLELSQRSRPIPTGPSDAYRNSGDAISEAGSSDQHHRDHHGGDAMNGIEPNEAYQQHSRESTPYEQTAGPSNAETQEPPATHFMSQVDNANSSMTMNSVRREYVVVVGKNHTEQVRA